MMLLTGSVSTFDHSSSLIRLMTELQLELPAPKIQDTMSSSKHPDHLVVSHSAFGEYLGLFPLGKFWGGGGNWDMKLTTQPPFNPMVKKEQSYIPLLPYVNGVHTENFTLLYLTGFNKENSTAH
jgi:hypothetical protein